MFETRPFKARFKSGIFFRIWLHARSARNSIPALQQPFDDLFSAEAEEGCGGTKLARSRPQESNSATQRLSFGSVFCPGRPWKRCGFTSSFSNFPGSRIFPTGFQYTPVDSIAACVTLDCVSQVLKRTRSSV